MNYNVKYYVARVTCKAVTCLEADKLQIIDEVCHVNDWRNIRSIVTLRASFYSLALAGLERLWVGFIKGHYINFRNEWVNEKQTV